MSVGLPTTSSRATSRSGECRGHAVWIGNTSPSVLCEDASVLLEVVASRRSDPQRHVVPLERLLLSQ
jgi:hypothetical protein